MNLSLKTLPTLFRRVLPLILRKMVALFKLHFSNPHLAEVTIKSLFRIF